MRARVTRALAIIAAAMLSAQTLGQAQDGAEPVLPTTAPTEPMDAIDLLLERVEELGTTVEALRTALADSKLETADRQRDRTAGVDVGAGAGSA